MFYLFLITITHTAVQMRYVAPKTLYPIITYVKIAHMSQLSICMQDKSSRVEMN